MGPQKGFSVSVPPRSSGAEIHHALLNMGESQDEVHLRAGSAMFLTPREICGLRALIDWAARVAGRVVFHSPVSGDLHRYLARVNFYADLPANVEITQPVPALKRRDRRERLIELTRIRTVRDVEALFGRVSRYRQRTVRRPIGGGPGVRHGGHCGHGKRHRARQQPDRGPGVSAALPRDGA